MSFPGPYPVLKGWAKALRLAGNRVSTAATAQEALNLTDEHPFELTVRDFLRPAMTGIELLTRLRKKLPAIRSVVISDRIDKKLTADELTSKLRDTVEAGFMYTTHIQGHRMFVLRLLLLSLQCGLTLRCRCMCIAVE
jgi:DNA-binding NtrC family response regulator